MQLRLRSLTRSTPAILAGLACLLAIGSAARPARALDVDLTVRESAGVPRNGEVATTGVPLPMGALSSPQAAAISGVDAQFQSLATWADGSVKWLLVSFPVTLSAWETGTYQLIDGGGDAAGGELTVSEASGVVTVDTGPLKFTLKEAGFNLFDEVWLDTSGDGSFTSDERMVSSRTTNGSLVEDTSGNTYSSVQGPNVTLTVEEAGPLRAVVHFVGRHSGAAGDFLDFEGRVFATRGRSDVRVQYSQKNMTPTGTYAGGNQPLCRWLAGEGSQGGAINSAHFEDLSLVTRVDLTGTAAYALEGNPGRGVSTGTLTADAMLYQDSSGGPYWYVTGGTTIGGYELRHGSSVVDTGTQAEGFADINDGTRGLAVGIRHFWENFPNKVEVSPDGTVTVGVMPREFADPYEHRPGERKTHDTLFYFHAGNASSAGVSDVAAAFQSPLRAMASARHYADTGVFEDMVPYDPASFNDYEVHNAVGAEGFLHIRDQADFYGWQDFGDAWSDFEGGGAPPNTNNAANNLEYDIGYSAIMQAARTAGLNDDLSDQWWQFAEAGNIHTADIDIYHVTEGPLHWMWGGMWTHCGHGASGYVDPHRGDVSNGAHSWNRGMVYWYYFTGDRATLDGALLVGENMTWRVENGPGMPGISGTQGEERGPGHTLQIMTDMYLLTWDQRYLDAARKVVNESHGLTKDYIVNPSADGWKPKPWMVAILMKSLGRYIQVMDHEVGIVETDAIESLLAYADWMANVAWVDRNGSDPGYFHYQIYSDGTILPGGMNVNMWTLKASDGMTYASRYETDPTKAARFRQVAQHAFEDGSAYPWCYTCPNHEYMQVKVHSVVAYAGQQWMLEVGSGGAPSDSVAPSAINDLAAVAAGTGEIDLTWTAPGDDGSSGRAISYLVRRSTSAIGDAAAWNAATPVTGAPVPQNAGASESMTVAGLSPSTTYYFAVRARDDALNVGGLSNSPSATTDGDQAAPVLSNIQATESSPGTLSFTWNTDEAADSEVEWDAAYGGSGPLANVVQSALLTTSHALQVSGLTAGTRVHYRVKSTDASGNEAADSIRFIDIQTTDTTAPSIVFGPSVSVDSTATQAVVLWITDEPAVGWVEWGTTTSYGQATAVTTVYSTDHRHEITGLTNGQTIHYRVHVTDGSGNETIGGDESFAVEIDVTAPVVSDPEIITTASQMMLTFVASEPSFGTFSWGTDPGNLGNLVLLASISQPAMLHAALLEGLTVSTTYHWSLSLSDPSGNIAQTQGEFLFLGDVPYDAAPPIPPDGLYIANFDEEFGVALQWAPNSESDLAGYDVHRRPLAESGDPTADWVTVNGNVLVDTAFLDDGVAPGVAYEYEVVARDIAANESSPSESVEFDPDYWESLRNYLGPAHPNPAPAGTGTRIDFRAPALIGVERIPAEMAVYDITGRRVTVLFRGVMAPGEIRTARWDGRDFSGLRVGSGVYFVQLRVGDRAPVSRKVTFLR